VTSDTRIIGMTQRSFTACLSLAAWLAAAGAAPGQIIHRYTFNGVLDARDSVGTANGTLISATTGGGQLFLNNGAGLASNSPAAKYVSLPAAAFPTGAGGLTSFTIEMFYNWVGQPGQTWARMVDFNNGSATSNYLFLTPRSGAQPINTVRYAITNGGPGNEFQVNGTAESPSATPTFMALTYDFPTTTATLYMGSGTTLTQVGQNLTAALNPTQLAVTNYWIGRSPFDGDPLFNGTIDQLDIFGGARTQAQVLADFLAGPVPLPEPSTFGLVGAAAAAGAALRRYRRRTGCGMLRQTPPQHSVRASTRSS
jgi:Concanavalin A-like lectin/glucanases superfamily/PEP-CTERM motif